MSRIVAQQLRKAYPTPDGELVIFDNLDLTLGDGEALAVVGPSGCGKSTLLHCLGTLDPPSGGTLAIDDVRPYELDSKSLAAFRNAKIGFIFQESYLLPQLTALQNVLVPALARKSVDAAATARGQALLERVGLGHRMTHLPSQLSGGERARVALARALVLSPQLLLADEPTGSLDPVTADSIADLLFDLQAQEQVSLVVVTHSRELADRLPRKLSLASRDSTQASVGTR